MNEKQVVIAKMLELQHLLRSNQMGYPKKLSRI